MRLAIYLNSIGITPDLAGNSYRDYLVNLTRQIQHLEQDQQKQARQNGRILIRILGIDKAARDLIPIPPNQLEREFHRQKRLVRMQYWPIETPPCPTCKFKRFNLPKKSWPSKRDAEQKLAKHKNTPLVVYECPAHEGYWHLGHPKKQKSQFNEYNKELGHRADERSNQCSHSEGMEDLSSGQPQPLRN